MTVKLPQFWTTNSDAWFLPVEACFRQARVTDQQTTFDHVVMQLPNMILSHFKDLIRNPGKTPYDTLKARLIKDLTPPTWDAISVADPYDFFWIRPFNFLLILLIWIRILQNHIDPGGSGSATLDAMWNIIQHTCQVSTTTWLMPSLNPLHSSFPTRLPCGSTPWRRQLLQQPRWQQSRSHAPT